MSGKSLLFGRGFCRTDIHLPINLHGICPDNLPGKTPANLYCSRGFSYTGGSAYDNNFSIHTSK